LQAAIRGQSQAIGAIAIRMWRHRCAADFNSRPDPAAQKKASDNQSATLGIKI